MSQAFGALSHCQPYNIGKRNSPDLFPKFQMQFDADQLELALKHEMSLCGF